MKSGLTNNYLHTKLQSVQTIPCPSFGHQALAFSRNDNSHHRQFFYSRCQWYHVARLGGLWYCGVLGFGFCGDLGVWGGWEIEVIFFSISPSPVEQRSYFFNKFAICFIHNNS